MVFTAPAVHYSALATLPPELTSSTSRQSIRQTASIRFKLNQIFKKLLNNDLHNEQTIITEIEKQIQLPKTIEKEDATSNIVKNPSNNNSGNRIAIDQESSRSMPSLIEPLERLPFTESYASKTPKHEKVPFELSAYHKHCIRQQKYIGQKQYPSESSSPSLLSSIKENRPDSATYRLQNASDQQHQLKFHNKKTNSTTTLPASPSIENRIGLQYASQRNTIITSHGIRSSYTQQQTQRLRRLHSKSKIRPISNESKPSSSVSSSIAHRIELLKQAMHNPQLEVHHMKSHKLPPLESSSPPLIDTIHKQIQTNTTQLKPSEIHHIHHHHIHSSSSSFFSMEWRTYLSIIGTLSVIFLLLIELTTNIF